MGKTRRNSIVIIATDASMANGASWSLAQLAEGLNSLGLNVSVVLPKEGDLFRYLNDLGIACCVIRNFSFPMWVKLIGFNASGFIFECKSAIKKLINVYGSVRLHSYLKKNHCGLVHVNALTSCFGAKEASRLSIPLVWHAREFMEEDVGFQFNDKAQAEKRIASLPEKVICVSHAVAEKTGQYVPDAKVAVVHNGVSVSRFSGVQPMGFDNGLQIASVGRIARGKGFDVLLRAIALLPSDVKQIVSCRIVGFVEDKLYFEYLKGIVEAEQLGEVVSFEGFCSEIETVYQQANILAVCSKKEAFGRTTAEGMLSGMLVIGSNSGGTAELIEDGDTGLLFDPGDPEDLARKILYVHKHPDEASDICRRAKAHARQHFSSDSYVAGVLGVYASALSP